MDETTGQGTGNPVAGAGEGLGNGIEDARPGDEGRGAPQVTADTFQTNPNMLHVRLEAYDGPLDLLLELIRKNEMDIYDIPIAEITRQYLETLAKMKELNLDVAGEFLVMAATLIYIKSRMLLPVEKEIEEEEGGDPREELVRKLLEYQAFKEAARELGFLEGERSKIFTRQITDYYLADLDPEDEAMDAFSANLYDLFSAFQSVLNRSGRDQLHEVFEEIISIEEKIAEIRSVLLHQRRILFSQLFRERRSRNELIATFLALLEIVRSRFARVLQEKQYEDIVIEYNAEQETREDAASEE